MFWWKPARSGMPRSNQLTFSFGWRPSMRESHVTVPNQKDHETPGACASLYPSSWFLHTLHGVWFLHTVNILLAFPHDSCLILLIQLQVSQWGHIPCNSLLLNSNVLNPEFSEMILWDTINYPKLKSYLWNKFKKGWSITLLYNKVNSLYRENKN